MYGLFKSKRIIAALAATVCVAATLSCHREAAKVVAPQAKAPVVSERVRVEEAFARFRQELTAMNPAAVAALFEPEGEIVNEGQEPLHGRAAIQHFLEGFSNYRILSYDAQNVITTVAGDNATLIADYRQQVRTPDQKVIQASGHLNSEWNRDGSGTWLIHRMSTTPEK